ncbi:MAG: hypothetical protein JST54_33205 [Deltaproteobacteria bacterium]|nr:hypothetical protein [Deltaproteobacteria bacterium]
MDRALTVYRSQFKELFKLSLSFALIEHIVNKAWEYVVYAKAPIFFQIRSLADVPQIQDVVGPTLWSLGSTLTAFGLSIAFWQASVGAVSTDATTSLGRAPLHAGSTWRVLRPRLVALTYTLVLELAVILGTVLLGAIPVILGVLQLAHHPGDNVAAALLALGLALSLFLMAGLFLVAMLRYLLVPSVVVVERLSGWAALSRASALMRGRNIESLWINPKVRGSLLLLVVGLATNAVMLVATSPRSLVLLAGGSATANPIAQLLLEAVEVLASTAVLPFGMVTVSLFYLDIRIRREGLDLELAATELAKAA